MALLLTPSLIAFLLALALTLPAAHLIGRSAARRRSVAPGRAREVMPSLPSAPPRHGSAERRWDRAMDRIERELLARFAEQGALDVEAHELAAQLGEHPERLEAVLARMREEIPSRMRIMRSGAIRMDFSSEHLLALKRSRRRSMPRKLALGAIAAVANLGAAWPFLSLALIVLVTLSSMLDVSQTAFDAEQAMISVGVTGLMASAAVIGATLALGLFMQLALTPWLNSPRLKARLADEPRPARKLPRYRHDPVPLLYLDAPLSQHYIVHSASTSWWGRGGSSSSRDGDGSSLDLDDLGEGAAIALIVMALLAILAAAVTLIAVWLRGIWRAVRRLDEPPLSTSPTLWIRTAPAIDKWERFVPTNDLVIRTLHALKRQIDHRRAPDDDLAARLLILAKSKGGVLTGLDIVFHEGLDLGEAHEVGARLTGILDGQILHDNEGELAFAFPPRALEKLVAEPDQDLWSEYLTFDRRGAPERRAKQPKDGVPVNLVGLTLGHLHASARLVAGTYLMALMAAWFVSPLNTFIAPLPAALSWAILLSAAVMTFGATTLVAVAHYMAAHNAALGVRRDVRRAAFKRVAIALEEGASLVHFEPLVEQLFTEFRPAWRELDQALVRSEVRAVALDLELEPTSDARYVEQESYELSSLRRRLEEDRAFASVFDFERVAFEFHQALEQGAADEVVFDTAMEREHVTALGSL